MSDRPVVITPHHWPAIAMWAKRRYINPRSVRWLRDPGDWQGVTPDQTVIQVGAVTPSTSTRFINLRDALERRGHTIEYQDPIPDEPIVPDAIPDETALDTPLGATQRGINQQRVFDILLGGCGMTAHRISSNKDVRKEAKVLERLGFAFKGRTSSGHPRFIHPAYEGEIHLPAGRASHRWLVIHRSNVASLMGLTSGELDARIEGRRPGGGPIKANPAGPGRKSNKDVVIEYAASLGIPLDRDQAGGLLTRYGTVKAARGALDGMVEAKQERRAA